MALPNTRVVHPSWSEHHRPTATGTLTGTCTITHRPTGGGTTGPTGNYTPPTAATIYDGPCRIIPVRTDERLRAIGGTQQTHRRYQVSIRYDADALAVGDIVTVNEAADPQMAGMRLRIIDHRYGTEQWERDLICDEMEA